jgi:VWFA-related protein
MMSTRQPHRSGLKNVLLRCAPCVASIFLLSHTVSGQTSVSSPNAGKPIIRSTSELVIVPASVLSPSGDPLTGLQADDFRLTDNGAEQKVFSQQGKGQALALVIVMETGGGASGLLQSYDGLDKIVEKAFGGTDRLALVTFDSHPEEIWGFPTLVDGLYYALTHQERGDDGAAILDAVSHATQLLQLQPPNFRRIVILLSEGQDHGSEIHVQDVLPLLGKSNTTVYSLVFSPEQNVKRTHRHRSSSAFTSIANATTANSAEELAAQSGGGSSNFSDPDGLEKQLMAFADRIDKEYILSFTPSSRQFGLHTIAVQIDKRVAAKITARKAYWLENTPEQ